MGEASLNKAAIHSINKVKLRANNTNVLTIKKALLHNNKNWLIITFYILDFLDQLGLINFKTTAQNLFFLHFAPLAYYRSKSNYQVLASH